jgi:uncharacterized tellurite resistance protein B-like protein
MPSKTRQELTEIIESYVGVNEPATVRIVTAIAGLLACVAYADRKYTDSEHDHIRRELARIRALSVDAVEAISAILKENISDLTVTSAQGYMRDLLDLTDHETRLQVLDTLMNLAAIDDVVSTEETNFMRRAANGLGLSPHDYNAAQARFRDKLAVLKK